MTASWTAIFDCAAFPVAARVRWKIADAAAGPVAERLMSQGEELIVWNRSKQRLQGIGATIADSPADLFS